MRFVVLGVFEEDFVHVGGGVLEQFVAAAEDDEGDLAVAQHRQLVGLLHQPEFAFGERHLSVAFVRDPRNLNLLPAHFDDDVICFRLTSGPPTSGPPTSGFSSALSTLVG